MHNDSYLSYLGHNRIFLIVFIGIITLTVIIVGYLVYDTVDSSDYLLVRNEVRTPYDYKKSFSKYVQKQEEKEGLVEDLPDYYYKPSSKLSDQDYSDLLKIVEAEATNQGFDGKVAVTQVIMFRVLITGASYHDVIFADDQFSPIKDGRFDEAVPTEETIQAVNAALGGKQVVNPRCYFFYNPDASNQDWSNDSGKIFDRRVGDHVFFLATEYEQ